MHNYGRGHFEWHQLVICQISHSRHSTDEQVTSCWLWTLFNLLSVAPMISHFRAHRACSVETSCGQAGWLPVGSTHKWLEKNRPNLDFPNVTGPNWLQSPVPSLRIWLNLKNLTGERRINICWEYYLTKKRLKKKKQVLKIDLMHNIYETESVTFSLRSREETFV